MWNQRYQISVDFMITICFENEKLSQILAEKHQHFVISTLKRHHYVRIFFRKGKSFEIYDLKRDNM